MSHSTGEGAGWLRAVGVDLLAGTVGGMAQALVGHPFDTVKVRLQASGRVGFTQYRGPWDCLVQTLRHEGVKGLYKGLSPPLALTGFTNAVMFAINSQMKKIVASFKRDPTSPLTLPQIIVAAEMTAPVYSTILCPIEVVKLRLQVQSAGTEKLYSGPIDCVRKIFRSEGARGFFAGLAPTIGTRLIGSPVYFGTYEAAKRFLRQGDEPPSWWVLLTAGGIGGIAFWTANYPLDLIKTQMQTQRGHGAGSSLVATVKNIYHSKGVLGFYRGYVPCVLRAFPANSVVFLGYELTSRALQPSKA